MWRISKVTTSCCILFLFGNNCHKTELQNSFKRIGITKVLDVPTLTRGSYAENLEVLQWLKAYYEQHVPQNAVYDAAGRREGKPAQIHPVVSSSSSSDAPAAATFSVEAPVAKPAVAPAVVEKRKPVEKVPVAAVSAPRSNRSSNPAPAPATVAPTKATEAPKEKTAPLRTVANNTRSTDTNKVRAS
jgi:hypothetical protein